MPLEEISPPDSTWSPQDMAAWNDLGNLAATIDASSLTGQRELMELVQRTVVTVARQYGGDSPSAHLRFTVPEGLRLISVSAERIRELFVRAVPGSDTIRAEHLVWVRDTHETVVKSSIFANYAWNAYRAVRVFLNPYTAVAYELKNVAFGHLMDGITNYMKAKLVRIVIEEVGRTAIELYSGRLNDRAAAVPMPEAPVVVPLRILVAGSPLSGKSSLVNALLGDIRAPTHCIPTGSGLTEYRLDVNGQPSALLIDCPGDLTKPVNQEAFLKEALACDLIVWVTSANAAARQGDRVTLDAVRARFGDRRHLRLPPTLIVTTHIDKLKPFAEWLPPYNLCQPGESAKASNIRAAVTTIAADLVESPASVIPVSLREGTLYNLDVVWAKIAEALPDARRSQILRVITESRPEWEYSRVLKQIQEMGAALFAQVSK